MGLLWVRCRVFRKRRHRGVCITENVIPALPSTAYSCNQHGPATAWFMSARPGNGIPVPKTPAVFGVGVNCLLSCNYFCQGSIKNVFVKNYSTTPFIATKYCDIFQTCWWHMKFFFFTFCWPCIMQWFLVNDQRGAQIPFYVFILFIYNTLHVSSTSCSSSGETNCINTTSGTCHSENRWVI